MGNTSNSKPCPKPVITTLSVVEPDSYKSDSNQTEPIDQELSSTIDSEYISVTKSESSDQIEKNQNPGSNLLGNRYLCTLKTPASLIPTSNPGIPLLTFSSSDWFACRDFIVTGFLKYYRESIDTDGGRFNTSKQDVNKEKVEKIDKEKIDTEKIDKEKIDKADREKGDLIQQLEIQGWANRAYDGYNFIRGEIITPSKFNINLYVDSPSASFCVDTKLGPFNINDPINGITSSLSKVLALACIKVEPVGITTVETFSSTQAQSLIDNYGLSIIDNIFTDSNIITKMIRDGHVSEITGTPLVYYKITIEYLS